MFTNMFVYRCLRIHIIHVYWLLTCMNMWIASESQFAADWLNPERQMSLGCSCKGTLIFDPFYLFIISKIQEK